MSHHDRIIPTPVACSFRSVSADVLHTDWNLCAVCQNDTGEKLVIQSSVTRPDQRGQGYHKLANNLLEKHGSESPIVTRLDEGGGIELTFNKNNAVWHMSCYRNCTRHEGRRAEKRRSAETPRTISPVKTRIKKAVVHRDDPHDTIVLCFFCDKAGGEMHRASTMGVDVKVRACATSLQDTRLLAKLAMGDMHALDAMYHLPCLVDVYNRAREQEQHISTNEKTLHAIALSELVAYIEESKEDDAMSVFKLSDLVKLYTIRLQQLGVIVRERVNSSRLKDRILQQISELRACNKGREVILAFEHDIAGALDLASQFSHDNDSIYLNKAAQIVRKQMFKTVPKFDGSFTSSCQKDSVPTSLLALVSMILEGPTITDQSEQNSHVNNAALVLSQLMIFNSVQHTRVGGKKARHVVERETPVAIYTAMVIHAQTRKRSLVDKLYHLGVCVAYDRLLQISTDMGNKVCATYRQTGIVCPPKLMKDLFTTGCADNIDHNPSSRTSKDSFHGTAISVTQHPCEGACGNSRDPVDVAPDVIGLKRLLELPQAYTDILPVIVRPSELHVPTVSESLKPNNDLVLHATALEFAWLEKVKSLIESSAELAPDDWISWSAFQASQQPEMVRPPAITALLPLFAESAQSHAMILHAMTVVYKAIQHVNPGQTPVIEMDQPLFAIAKEIQWDTTGPYNEDNYIVLLGGLHIEMVVLKIIGDWLDNSGWVGMIVQAGVTTPGKANAILKGSHVTRARYAHQVTAAALYILQKIAYQSSKGDQNDGHVDLVGFQAWYDGKCEQHPQFHYWSQVLELELLLLKYVRALRVGDFGLYVQTLGQLAPWTFALDHYHYARWLSVHIRDMMVLENSHPRIYHEFVNGKFVMQKSRCAFSMMALDQNHEQQNDLIKGDGGAVGLTQDPAALKRWMLSGPEVARCVTEFENTFLNTGFKSTKHHDQTPSVQREFAKDVKAVIAVFQELGNPFCEDSNDLIVIDTKDIMPKEVVASVRSAKRIGQEQFNLFTTERLETCATAFSDTVHKNKLPLCGTPVNKNRTAEQRKVSTLKNDLSLFGRLYIACQSRDGNLAEFFRHENQECPPALSIAGKLRFGQKSDLLQCLEDEAASTTQAPSVDAIIFDGAAVVHMLPPRSKCKTFGEYAQVVFVPYLKARAETVDRVDVVWDRYFEKSLKQSTRDTRGHGLRKRVLANAILPGNWQSFLRSEENKTELFVFLSEYVTKFEAEDKVLISTVNDDVVSSVPIDKSGMVFCSHEEADTRILLHVYDAAKQFSRIMVRTVDTDVVVLCVSNVRRLQVDELWVAFGTGKHMRYIPTHAIADSLGPDKYNALPFFHAVTGCDTVSSFCGRGKKTAYDIWRAYPAITPVFQRLASMPANIADEDYAELERFVVLLYDRGCSHNEVNRARQVLFAKSTRSLEYIPPTQAALQEHIKRAVLQAGYIWSQTAIKQPELPSPELWGWKPCEQGWTPKWTTLPEASKVCQELIQCGCKKACRGLCKCSKAGLPCTSLCYCAGNCHRQDS